MNKTLFIRAIWVAVLQLLTLSSCMKEERPLAFSDEMRQQMENEVSGISDTDTLQQLARQYKHEGNYLGQVAALRRCGGVFRQKCHFTQAIECHGNVADLAIEEADTLLWVCALNEIGTDFHRMGALNKAVESYQRALTLGLTMARQDSRLVKKNRVISYNGIGNVMISIGHYALADTIVRAALRGEEELGSIRGQAVNLANLGTIKEMRGDLDSAWVFYRMALQKNKECASREGVALCHNRFGQLYEKNRQFDKALAEYQTAQDMMSGSDDDWHMMEATLGIARVYLQQNRTAEAEQLLDNARKKVEDMGSTEHLQSIYLLLYELRLKGSDYRQALDYYVKASELQDSLIGLQKLIQIHNTRMMTERNASEKVLKTAEEGVVQERHTRYLYMLIAAVVLVMTLSLTGLLWVSLRMRKARQKVILQNQKMRESFFTNVTHEFRTPLTVILGLGHQLEDSEIEDIGQVRSAAKMIVRQGNSLLGLINQLLDISKIRSAIGEPRWRRGNLVPFVMMAVDNFRTYAENKRIELTFSHSLTTIGTDFVPEYVQKIISNLLSNAIKYTSEYGKVNVTLEQTAGNRVKLQVFDTGKGIEEEYIPHVFDAFYQARNKISDMGTGIGLSLVKLMTEAMNGTVEVQSIVGQGSTFTVVLPITCREGTPELEKDELPQAGAQIPMELSNSETIPSPALQKAQGLRILIVEDNQDIAFYIGMHLPPNCERVYARTADAALEKAGETIPDIIITDIMMPGSIDGLELCRRIRQTELLSHIPIIIITAKTSEADRIKGLEAGADAYLVKPFNSEELTVRISKLMERQRQMRDRFALLPPDSAKQKEDQLPAEDLKFLGKVADAVYKMMAQGKTDVETLADQLAISRSQLNRKMLAITGQNTSAYVMRLRLARAKRLLKSDTQMPVGDVALKCGFEDVAYFSRIFKMNFDMTPSQYRRIE